MLRGMYLKKIVGSKSALRSAFVHSSIVSLRHHSTGHERAESRVPESFFLAKEANESSTTES